MVIEMIANALVKKVYLLWEGVVFFSFKITIHMPYC
jgi:hypothetical protein